MVNNPVVAESRRYSAGKAKGLDKKMDFKKYDYSFLDGITGAFRSRS